MAHGIEARIPFLDHHFLEQVFSYQYYEFMKNGLNKAMLRESMKGFLPPEVISRKSKSPRPGNNAHLIYYLLKTEMMDILHSRLFQQSHYWKPNLSALFQRDCLEDNIESAETWFRVYLLMRWLSMCQFKSTV